MTEPRNIEEIYELACSTSNLRVVADRGGDGDVMVAAGWSDSRLGMTLLRLRSACSRGALADAVHALCARAERGGIAADAVVPTLCWWLNQACTQCGGHGKTLIPGAPTLSGHDCQACRGAGEKKLPWGAHGRWLANVMDSSVGSARMSLQHRFRHQAR